MRITTAEIKRLLRECADAAPECTIHEFREYIARKSGKEFTRGQISGALYQLSQSGELISVERGIYRKGEGKEEWTGLGSEVLKAKGSESEAFMNSLETSKFAKEICECLTDTKDKLTQISKENSVLDMNKGEFELLTDVKRLKEEIDRIVLKCR